MIVLAALTGVALVVFFVPIWILVLALVGWAYWRSHRVRREVRSLVEKVERVGARHRDRDESDIPPTPKPADPVA